MDIPWRMVRVMEAEGKKVYEGVDIDPPITTELSRLGEKRNPY